MAQPVWVLSVDLQAKTATFQSGLSEAAKTARGAFTDIKDGAGEMGRAVGTSAFESRHAVMLLGDELGGHLPRGVTAFLVSLGPVGEALEAAFPFLAIAVGATILIEHLVKLQEEGQKLTSDQMNFGTAVKNAFSQLDQKLIQAGIRSDELRNNHIGALAKQLELIDKQSMAELVHSFGEVQKAADLVFADLKTSWYNVDAGSTGAKNALDAFQTQYQSLLAQGKDKEASDLLRGTKESAEKILTLQKQAAAYVPESNFGSNPRYQQDPKQLAVLAELEKAKAGYSENEVKAQQQLVGALTAQLGVEERVAALKKADSANAGQAAGNEAAGRAAAMARQAADSQSRMAASYIAADKATASARLEISRASIAERLQNDLDFAAREMALQEATNAAQIAALDKSSKDYQSQLKMLNDKTLEIQAEHDAKVAELTARASVEQAAHDLQTLETSIRSQINATVEGTAERLAVISAGIRTEEAQGLQETSFYRELAQERIRTVEKMVEDERKLKSEAGDEEADNDQKLGEIALQRIKQQQAVLDSAHRVSIQQQIQEQVNAANAEFALKQQAMLKKEADLDKFAKDYETKLRAIQNKETQLARAHENELTAIKEKAEEERNQRILSAETHFTDSIAQGLTNSIMRHQTWGQMVTSIGNQVVSGMLQNAIKSMLTLDMTKEKEAAAAARKMFNAGMQFPFPANVVLAPAMAAAGFAAVMAFEAGTDSVPGYGKGDKIPAMLEPGEGVVPGGVMAGLRDMVANGGMKGNVTHVHVRPHYELHSVDHTGMKNLLKTHTKELTSHFRGVVRGMNK